MTQILQRKNSTTTKINACSVLIFLWGVLNYQFEQHFFVKMDPRKIIYLIKYDFEINKNEKQHEQQCTLNKIDGKKWQILVYIFGSLPFSRVLFIWVKKFLINKNQFFDFCTAVARLIWALDWPNFLGKNDPNLGMSKHVDFYTLCTNKSEPFPKKIFPLFELFFAHSALVNNLPTSANISNLGNKLQFSNSLVDKATFRVWCKFPQAGGRIVVAVFYSSLVLFKNFKKVLFSKVILIASQNCFYDDSK